MKQKIILIVSLIIFLSIPLTVLLAQRVQIYLNHASGPTTLPLPPRTPSVGVNKQDLFHMYLGLGSSGKYAKSWKIQGGSPAGSEAIRYARQLEGTNDGYSTLRVHTKIGSGSFSVSSEQFDLKPNINYQVSAFIRKGVGVGYFKVITVNSDGQNTDEFNYELKGSGVDESGQNWNDGFKLVKRSFSLTTNATTKKAYIQFGLNASSTRDQYLDVDSVEISSGSEKAPVPNPSFEYGDTVESKKLAVKSLDDAKNNNITYMRINAGGYCSYDFDYWKKDKNNYWQTFDEMVNDANARGIRLIPVILWNKFSFPHMVNEPLSKVVDTHSLTNQKLKEYTQELVDRYKNSQAILFWELTNELNLAADLDMNNRGHDPCLGDKEPLGNKNFTTDQMSTFMADFATFVKSADPNHMVSSGYSAPRPSAQHLRLHPEWVSGGDFTQDSYQEMKTWLKDSHPSPIDIASAHLYSKVVGNWKVSDIERATTENGKILFVGEFGDYERWGDYLTSGPWKNPSPFTEDILNTIVTKRIPFSAPWMWETYSSVNPSVMAENSIGPGINQHILDMIKNANQLLAVTPTPTPTPTPKLDPGKIRSVTFYNFPDSLALNPSQFLQDFNSDLPKIKDNGFNAVWFIINMDTFFDANGIPKKESFDNLKTILQTLKDNNMKAVLPLNYGGGNAYKEQMCNILTDHNAYLKYAKRHEDFMRQIEGYSDSVFILVFTESQWGCLGTGPGGDKPLYTTPEGGEIISKLLKISLGRLPKDIDPQVRSKFTMGYHDAFTPFGWNQGTPSMEADSYDFFSIPHYEGPIRSDDEIISSIEKKITNTKSFFPNINIFFGEIGASYCPSPWDEEKQSHALQTIASHFLEKGIGFNEWGWRPIYFREPDSTQRDCGAANGGRAIRNPDGTPKKAATTLKQLFFPSDTYLHFGSVKLHGIGTGGDNSIDPNNPPPVLGNPNPLTKTRVLTVEIDDASGILVKSAQGNIVYSSTTGDFSGDVTLSNLSSESYLIKVITDKYLKRQLTGIITLASGTTTQMPSVILEVGDIDGDTFRKVPNDYNILMDCYSDLLPAKNCSDPTKKAKADLSDDGKVNQDDYNLFLRELSVLTGD